jgi:transcriptional regulator with XRE-family HTH domain
MKIIRAALGTRQADLAKATGLSQSKISNFENEIETPTADELALIASALGVEIDALAPSKPAPLPLDVLLKTTEAASWDEP